MGQNSELMHQLFLVGPYNDFPELMLNWTSQEKLYVIGTQLGSSASFKPYIGHNSP